MWWDVGSRVRDFALPQGSHFGGEEQGWLWVLPIPMDAVYHMGFRLGDFALPQDSHFGGLGMLENKG